MATYKYSGNLGFAADTQLWKEMTLKEQYLNKNHPLMNQTGMGFSERSSPRGMQLNTKQILEAVNKNKLKLA